MKKISYQHTKSISFKSEKLQKIAKLLERDSKIIRTFCTNTLYTVRKQEKEIKNLKRENSILRERLNLKKDREDGVFQYSFKNLLLSECNILDRPMEDILPIASGLIQRERSVRTKLLHALQGTNYVFNGGTPCLTVRDLVEKCSFNDIRNRRLMGSTTRTMLEVSLKHHGLELKR